MEIDDPADTRLVFTLFNEIGILQQLSRARFEQLLPDGVTSPQFGVLNHLVRLGDGRTPRAIARAFQVSKPTMTHTLTGLENRGLVETRPNPKDGRSKLVYLTEAGRTFREDAIARVSPDFGRLTDQVDMEQLAAILPTLQRLREIMDRDRDEE